MTRNRKILIIILMVIYVALSVFFWLITKHWYCGLIPTIGIIAWELIERSRIKPVPPVAEDIAPIAEPANLITSISVLLLNQFIVCITENDLSVLGTGTDEQKQICFNDILSQYYSARKDEGIKEYVKLLKEVKLLELSTAVVAQLSEILKERYSYAAANGLRRLYPLYKLTPETYIKDLSSISNGEMAKTRKLDIATKKLHDYEAKQSQTDKPITKEQKKEGFINRLADINKYENGSYKANEITVLEYAVLESRLDKHIEQLKAQAQNGR